MQKPLVSIGMIFKNEIRCLERCLQSLEPLRRALPCELVMADTGAGDGSREIAERYADILIDFPWINDFSAARNAVMDRCRGTWYFSIDADEWLDENVDQLLRFFRSSPAESAYLIVRSYARENFAKEYQDAMLPRLIRMSTGVRFSGAIHEAWCCGRVLTAEKLNHTILHHDGYVGLSGERGRAKRERNMELLRKTLAENPESLRTLLECIESCGSDIGAECENYIRRGIAGIKARRSGWDSYGQAILRYAVVAAEAKGFPELEEWIALAEELFPDSFYTRIDVQQTAAVHSWNQGDYADCIRRGEMFLAACDEYHRGEGDQDALMYSTIIMATHRWERHMRMVLANAFQKEGDFRRSWKLLEEMDLEGMDGETAKNFLILLRDIHACTTTDTAPLLLRFYEELTASDPEEEGKERRAAFAQSASLTFSHRFQKEESEKEGRLRRAYTLFLPLNGLCELGTAAAVLEAESIREMEALLETVRHWDEFPISVLLDALERGVKFPLAGNPLRIEEMDALAGRMAQDWTRFSPLMQRVLAEDYAGNWQDLAWARGLALSAVRHCDWNDRTGEDMSIAEGFLAVERTFLPRYYAPALLREETIGLLPPLHRFGWYCDRAFCALESGNAAGAVHFLRTGLKSCPHMKGMVEFLLDRTEAIQAALAPSPELQALAGQVRAILARYSPEDPAVQALKASEAYRKVARFIEGPQ